MKSIVFSYDWLNALSQEAAGTDRGRKHLNLHDSYLEPCQRLFNAIGEWSYIRPHRHSLDPRVETLIAVSGLFGLITFNDVGTPERVDLFGSGAYAGAQCGAVGVAVAPHEWHMVVALAPNSVIFEVKAGPFDPLGAKEYAVWAPDEDSDSGLEFLEDMRRLALRSRDKAD